MAVIDSFEVGGTTYDLNAVALDTPGTINGVSFDGGDSVTNYAVCSTAAGTAAKVAGISNDFTLATGVTVAVKFSNANTASNPTLNVGSTGAKAIVTNGTTPAGAYAWAAGETVVFWYDGSYWQQVGGLQASATVLGRVLLDSAPTNASTNAVQSGGVYSAIEAVDEASLLFRGTLTSSDDVHALTQQGSYYFSGANQPQNLPSDFSAITSGYFRLLCVKSVSTTAHYGEWHLIVGRKGVIYSEYNSPGAGDAWSGWAKNVTEDSLADLESDSINLVNPQNCDSVSTDAEYYPTRTGLVVQTTSDGTYKSARFSIALEPNTDYTFVGMKTTTAGAGFVGYREYDSSLPGDGFPNTLTKTLMTAATADDTQALTTFTTVSGQIRLYFYCTGDTASAGDVEFYNVAIYKGSYTASTIPPYVRAVYAQDDQARNDIDTLNKYAYLTKTTLTSADDVHTLTEQGVYYFIGSNQPANLPSVFANISSGSFRLLDVKHPNNKYGEWQMLSMNDGSIWTEKCLSSDGSSWSDWVHLVDGDQMFPLSLLTASVIPNGTDFDTITTPGSYYIQTSQNAATMSNIPDAVAGRLNVMALTPATRFYQVYFTVQQSADIYVRAYTGNGWGAWKRIAYV